MSAGVPWKFISCICLYSMQRAAPWMPVFSTALISAGFLSPPHPSCLPFWHLPLLPGYQNFLPGNCKTAHHNKENNACSATVTLQSTVLSGWHWLRCGYSTTIPVYHPNITVPSLGMCASSAFRALTFCVCLGPGLLSFPYSPL